MIDCLILRSGVIFSRYGRYFNSNNGSIYIYIPEYDLILSILLPVTMSRSNAAFTGLH